MFVEPDEIKLQIGIQEYWKEEFQKGKQYEDYVTKIPLEEIEKSLMAELSALGVTKTQMALKEAGNYWEGSGKDFKKSKTFELTFTDVAKVNEVIAKVKTRGVSSMRITELKNKNLTEYRKQVKIQAMKAAKEKAEYLLESIGEKLGKALSVVELDNAENTLPFYMPAQNRYSNTVMQTPAEDNSEDAIRKIKLRQEIKVRFEIAN